MKKKPSLKDRILRQNILSTYFIITILTILSFSITYFIVYEKYQTEISLIKNNYIDNQKNMMKHQVNNIIKLIETLRTAKTKAVKKDLETYNLAAMNILKNCPRNKYKDVLANLDKENTFVFFTISDLNANLIYTHLKDYNQTKRKKVIQNLLKTHKNHIYFTHKTPKGLKITYQNIFNNYLFTTCTYQHIIDSFVKSRIIQVVYNIRFGPKNNGYISIAKVLNYKGGKNFAQVVALPVKPSMVGKLLSDDKKDAKGKEYRKEYLKIINTKGEGFVSYWFYKYSDNIVRPKLSYIKLYKPWNWIIFTSVFIDDINTVLHKKELMFNKEVKKLILMYVILYIFVLIIASFIVKKENNVIKKIIEDFEEKINHKNTLLENLNKNLQNEVNKKTKELVNNMFTDSLTNLPNREKLINDNSKEYIAIINIDDFKEINDFYGIEEGDKVIKKFGEFLNSIQPTYKLSADEYAIIDKTPAKLKHSVSKIIKLLKSKKFKVGNDEISLNISAGIGKNLSEADTALKYAKKRKKQIIVYNKKLPILKEFAENLKWKKIINEAIENDNIIPFVQGIIDNNTKEIKKYECLMRIKHEDTIYSPAHFLDIAKKTHQYETLQQIMITKCFKKFSTLNYDFSINLSLKDLKNENFVRFLLNNINKYSVNNKLTIEILEDEEMISDQKVNEVLYKLSNQDVKIAIDDFGSGYSNFIYLIKNLPIDTLKIDGTLVKDILNDEKLFKLLEKIVEIANTFDFNTIAEYVETEEIYEKLKKINISASQGYYFSKPFNMEELD